MAPNRYFVAQFTNVLHFGGADPVTLQYKLFEGSNLIEVHYSAAPTGGGTHAAGIENETGTVGTQYYLGTVALATPIAVRYTPTTPIEVSAVDTATVTVLPQLLPDTAVEPSSPSRFPGSSKISATSWTKPRSTSCSTSAQPSRSTSIAERRVK